MDRISANFGKYVHLFSPTSSCIITLYTPKLFRRHNYQPLKKSFAADSFILSTCSTKNEAHLLVYNIKESTGITTLLGPWLSMFTVCMLSFLGIFVRGVALHTCMVSYHWHVGCYKFVCILFSDLDKIYDAKLTKTLKKFTIKPITQVHCHMKWTWTVVQSLVYLIYYSLSLQLAVLPECNIFLGLSDSEVFYADLEAFTILGHLPKSRGATYFAVDWQKLRGRVGFGRELRVGVSTKKRLQLYEWKRNRFDITKVATWLWLCLVAIVISIYHNIAQQSKKPLSCYS